MDSSPSTARKAAFIDFMVDVGVLTFGDFVTKSGRPTPYFVNTGLYSRASDLETLGEAYAATIVEHFGADGFDVLFGPAYKGIPLVVTVAMALRRLTGRDVPFCFNRKEVKDHGEGGQLVGHRLCPGERVLIVEDVTTAGTSIRETVPILRGAAEIHLAGLVVSVDRMERGPSGHRSALDEVADEHGMTAASIVSLDDLVHHLRPGGAAKRPLTQGQVERIRPIAPSTGRVPVDDTWLPGRDGPPRFPEKPCN